MIIMRNRAKTHSPAVLSPDFRVIRCSSSINLEIFLSSVKLTNVGIRYSVLIAYYRRILSYSLYPHQILKSQSKKKKRHRGHIVLLRLGYHHSCSGSRATWMLIQSII